MNNTAFKMENYTEVLAMVRMFFAFFGGASLFFVFALAIEIMV
ncbi:MAG: hypothetical protein ACRCV7_06460 [Culicoidibacterales bacterium]